jgi:hypothetical protein
MVTDAAGRSMRVDYLPFGSVSVGPSRKQIDPQGSAAACPRKTSIAQPTSSRSPYHRGVHV